MHIEVDWNFEEAIENINTEYPPYGHVGPQVRNRQLESWGQLVGRTRALIEFDLAVEQNRSLTALGKKYHITLPTLYGLRSFYSSLPDDRGRAGVHAGLILGQWRLIRRLGSGGNAEVWQGKSAAQQHVAIKILKFARGSGLKRFVSEIKILEQLGHMPGILPLIDRVSPEQTDSANHVWLALPVAVPLIKTLGPENDPEEIITGIRNVAETLTALHTQGISHRDIKPDNLLIWKDQWTVSDFGIASFPSKESLTVANKKLGPLYYIAPEMLTNADSADGTMADVYSLAKTLWVLLTGQKYPPPGEQRKDVESMRVSSWVSFSQSEMIDDLIELATRHEPERRPTMREVVAVINNWITELDVTRGAIGGRS